MFLVLLGEYAASSDCNSGEAVRRALAGEEPGSAPPPRMGSDAKGGDERDPPSRGRKADDDDDDKAVESKQLEAAIKEQQAVAPERGKSRGGTRGGARPQPTSNTTLTGVSERPSNMDAEIDKCDGSFEMTKELLGSLISKPKLSDKLLGKPPFRFLHDIVTEVVKTTGFAENLYDPEEMDSANVKEKEQKTLFLEKILKVVGVQLNTMVEAKPAKIVAGLEAQDTNRFLQLLALAARMMPEASNAVRVVHEQLGLAPPAAAAPPQRQREEAPAPTREESKPRQQPQQVRPP
jgi:TRAF3-interacting protein 1